MQNVGFVLTAPWSRKGVCLLHVIVYVELQFKLIVELECVGRLKRVLLSKIISVSSIIADITLFKFDINIDT